MNAPTLTQSFRVSGNSMAPTLQDGQLILIDAVSPNELRRRDIIVFQNIMTGKLSVKRFISIINGRAYVIGDNPSESMDSRHYGLIDLESIVGRLLKTRSA